MIQRLPSYKFTDNGRVYRVPVQAIERTSYEPPRQEYPSVFRFHLISGAEIGFIGPLADKLN